MKKVVCKESLLFLFLLSVMYILNKKMRSSWNRRYKIISRIEDYSHNK